MVFNDHGFSQHKCKQDGRNGGTCDVNHIRGANESAERIETGLTHHRESERGIVERGAWSLSYECELKLAYRAPYGTRGQSCGKRRHYRFHAANARRKKVGVEQKLHDLLFWGAERSRG